MEIRGHHGVDGTLHQDNSFRLPAADFLERLGVSLQPHLVTFRRHRVEGGILLRLLEVVIPDFFDWRITIEPNSA